MTAFGFHLFYQQAYWVYKLQWQCVEQIGMETSGWWFKGHKIYESTSVHKPYLIIDSGLLAPGDPII